MHPGCDSSVAIFSTLLIIGWSRAHVTHFSYNSKSPEGPDSWYKLDRKFSACSPKRSKSQQSPIHINPEETVSAHYSISYNTKLGRLRGKLVNNGHSPTVVFDKSNRILTGVPHCSRDRFVMHQLHFHFGPSEAGSEHHVDGSVYPGEIHFVHYNKKYRNYSEALKHKDGLAVVAVFIQTDDLQSQESRHFANFLRRIPNRGNHVTFSANPNELFPRKLNSFFTYFGSLTTPGCDESVRWIIMTRPVHIHKTLMNEFKNLRSGRNVNSVTIATYGNARPIQKLNKRLVEYSRPKDA